MDMHEWLKITDSPFKLLLLCRNCGYPWASYHLEDTAKCVLGPSTYDIPYDKPSVPGWEISAATHHPYNLETADIVHVSLLATLCDHRGKKGEQLLDNDHSCGYCGRWIRSSGLP